MFYYRQEADSSAWIYRWLMANKQAILDGNADFYGTPVNEKTVLRQYIYVVSPAVLTLSCKTHHMLPTKDNRHLLFTALKYSLISLVAGWWCFPWGPFYTLHALYVNLTGGLKQTAIGVLQWIEWGWEVPGDVGVGDFKRDLVDLTLDAASEIRLRQRKGEFPDGIGVRITPTKWADDEVEIAFDYPVSDGRFWVDESQGIVLIIDKDHETLLDGRTIDYSQDKFLAVMGRRPGVRTTT